MDIVTIITAGIATSILGTVALAAVIVGARSDRHATHRRMVFVCSPLRGDYQGNALRARMYCRQVLDEGHTPYAPHLFFTQFLSDLDPVQREQGINAGIEMLKRCDEVWVFTKPDGTLSEGMRAEVAVAHDNLIPVRYFSAAGVGADVNRRAA